MTTDMINTTAMISHATDPTVGSCCGCIGRAYDITASPRKSAPGETKKETSRARSLPGASPGAGHDQKEAAPKNIFARVADRRLCDRSKLSSELKFLKSHCPVACVAPSWHANCTVMNFP
jgi:hypothetical protein